MAHFITELKRKLDVNSNIAIFKKFKLLYQMCALVFAKNRIFIRQFLSKIPTQ